MDTVNMYGYGKQMYGYGEYVYRILPCISRSFNTKNWSQKIDPPKWYSTYTRIKKMCNDSPKSLITPKIRVFR